MLATRAWALWCRISCYPRSIHPEPKPEQLDDLVTERGGFMHQTEEHLPGDGPDDRAFVRLSQVVVRSVVDDRELSEQVPRVLETQDCLTTVRALHGELHDAGFHQVHLVGGTTRMVNALTTSELRNTRLPQNRHSVGIAQHREPAVPL